MPYARAFIKGNFLAPKLDGIVELYPYLEGTLVKVEIANLPPTKPISNNEAPVGPFGFTSMMELILKTHKTNSNKLRDIIIHQICLMPFMQAIFLLFYQIMVMHMIVYTDRFKPEEVMESYYNS